MPSARKANGHRGVIKDPDLSADYVRSLLAYDPATGVLRWRIDRHGKARAGDIAGSITLGYRRVKIACRSVFAHRLIWLLVTGEWPKGQIDHRDADGTNNRWENLREATPGQNARNRRKHVDNKTGYKGVFFNRHIGKYTAAITMNYQQRYLGSFSTAEAAALAYARAALELHGEFRRAA